MTLRIPGLAPIEGGLSALSALDDEALAGLLVAWLRELREVDLEALSALAALPIGEVAASPFGLRAVALGVEVGATSAHRERRALLPWSFGVTDPEHGLWDRGVLHVGKYQSFQAEAPQAVFDPAHVAKWGPHELLHRAVGFFFRADMSRFELYLGARLNELLPVALWYGHDQLARLDEDGFDRHRTPVQPRLTDARWLHEDDDALRRRVRRTLRWLRSGLRHVAEELAVIDRELATGRRLSSPRQLPDARLDAASDATAYVVGHWARLTDEATGAVLERVPHERSVRELRAAVEATHARLFFGDVELSADELEVRRRERTTWDWLLRAARVDPTATVALLSADRPLCEVDAWRVAIEEGLREGAGRVLADGCGGLALPQLAEGVGSVAPVVASILDEGALVDFAATPPRRGPLGERLEAFLRERGHWLADLVRLETILSAPPVSTGVPSLCEQGGDHVVRNDAFTLFEAPWDVVSVHAGEVAEPSAEGGAWLVGRAGDDVVVLEIDRAVRALWVALGERALPMEDALAVLGPEGLQQLVSLDVLGCRRLPREIGMESDFGSRTS